MTSTQATVPLTRSVRQPQTPALVLLGMALVLLLTTGLGARGLNANPLWNDELNSLEHIGGYRSHYVGGFDFLQTMYSVRDHDQVHAPGYFLLLGTWGSVAGWSPVALRYLSLLLGLIGVAFTYRLGRDTVSWRVGLFAALIMGTSGFFIYYTHELRMYSMNATVVIVALWSYHHVLTRRGTVRWYAWPLLTLAAAIPLYTHYFSGIVIGVLAGYHATFAFYRLVWQRATRNVWRWLFMGTAIGLAGLSFLPWIRTAVSGRGAAHGASKTLAETALNPVELVLALLERFGGGWAILTALGLALAAWYAFKLRRGSVFLWVAAAALLVGVVEFLGIKLISTHSASPHPVGPEPVLTGQPATQQSELC